MYTVTTGIGAEPPYFVCDSSRDYPNSVRFDGPARKQRALEYAVWMNEKAKPTPAGYVPGPTPGTLQWTGHKANEPVVPVEETGPFLVVQTTNLAWEVYDGDKPVPLDVFSQTVHGIGAKEQAERRRDHLNSLWREARKLEEARETMKPIPAIKESEPIVPDKDQAIVDLIDSVQELTGKLGFLTDGVREIHQRVTALETPASPPPKADGDRYAVAVYADPIQSVGTYFHRIYFVTAQSKLEAISKVGDILRMAGISGGGEWQVRSITASFDSEDLR